jgi:hypothetical protein
MASRLPLTPLYTPGNFASALTDRFSFESPRDSPRAHASSETGYRSHFAAHDAVEAARGPHTCAAVYAEACGRGEEAAFANAVEAIQRESKEARRRRARRPEATPQPQPVRDQHTSQVIEQRAPGPLPKPPAQ